MNNNNLKLKYRDNFDLLQFITGTLFFRLCWLTDTFIEIFVGRLNLN